LFNLSPLIRFLEPNIRFAIFTIESGCIFNPMKKYIIISVLFALLKTSNAQSIYTVGGNGIWGYSGDGANGTSAKMFRSFGVANDKFGNTFVSDSNRIRKIDGSGIITTVAGNGLLGYSGDGGIATLAQINLPRGLAVDLSGNLYIADNGNHCIRKVNTSGIITTIAGDGNPGFSGDGGLATSAQLYSPNDIDVDALGNVYIVDFMNHKLRKINTLGIINTIAGTGVGGFSGDGGNALSAQLNGPCAIALDTSKNIYISDYINNRIRKIDKFGIISTIAGTGVGGFSGDGGNAMFAKIASVSGIAVDLLGNIYTTEIYNQRIRKISTSGIINTISGNGTYGYSGDGGPAISAQFSNPFSISVDPAYNIFISDMYNYRIRVICQTNCLAGVNELNADEKQILAYPNPNNGLFNINIEKQVENGEFVLFNLCGEKIHTQKISQGDNIIIKNELAKGFYNYTITSDKEKIGYGKLIIE
jgi:hypothetical protein